MTTDHPSPMLPPLPDLPVIRDKYCSQEMTDSLIRHLQEKRPDLIAELVRQEKRGLPDGRDEMHGKACERIIAYFRENTDALADIPPTRLGMLDLLYELSRRIRKVLELQDVPVFGNPLAPGPEGPFPALISTPVWGSDKGGMPISQDLADLVLDAAYRKSPEVFYEYAEQMRRLMRSYEITQALGSLVTNTLSPDQKHLWSHLGGEVFSRLHAMCQIPNFETLKSRFKP